MWWLWFNVKLFRSIALVTLFAKTEKSLISPLLWRAHLDFSDVGLFVRLLKLSLYLSDDQARCRRGWVGSTCPMEVLWSRPQHNSRALLCSGLSGHSRKVGPKKLGFPISSEIKHKSDFSFRTLKFNETTNFYKTRLKSNWIWIVSKSLNEGSQVSLNFGGKQKRSVGAPTWLLSHLVRASAADSTRGAAIAPPKPPSSPPID